MLPTPVFPTPVFEGLLRASVLLLLFTGLSAAAQTVSVTADLQAPNQTLDGFGATLKPLVYGGVDYLTPAQRTAALTAAIVDVGATVGALQLAVEGGANDNADPFVADPAGFDFSFHEDALDAFVTIGEPLGLTGWHPGSRWDQRGNHAWSIAVRDAGYANYLDEVAENFLQQMIWWRDTYGQVPSIIKLFNEPTSGNRELRASTGSGSTVGDAEIVDIIRTVGDRLRAAGFADVLFEVPSQETVYKTRDTAQLIYNDAQARQYVGALGYHPYPYNQPYSDPALILSTSGAGSPDASQISQRQSLAAMAETFSTALGRTVPLWMTEVSEGPGNNDFPFGSIQEVRARAIHIHDEFLYAKASAFYGMHLLWDQRSHAEHFGGSCSYEDEESSLVLIDNYDCHGDGDTRAITITGMGYAIGHYARWAPPGSVVVETTSGDPLVQVTGFHDTAADHLALVLLNNHPDAVTVEVALSGGSIAGGITGEASYADVRWGTAPAVDVTSDQLTLTLPPESVVSLGMSLGTTSSGASGPGATTPSLRSPYPNPSSGTAMVPFSTGHSGHVRLDVVDVLGRVVTVAVDDVRPAGLYAERLPVGLPAGRYTLRLRTAYGMDTAPLTVTR